MILASTTGFTMHKHYCMGRLKTVALFEKAESCMKSAGMEDTECPKNCCDDEEQSLKVDDLTNVSFEHDFSPTLLLSVLTFSLFEDPLPGSPSVQTEWSHYSTPHLSRDVPLLVQSFLL